MGNACCPPEKQDANDEMLDARNNKAGSNQQKQGPPGFNTNNPFKHRAGEGYDEQRAMKEAQE